MTDMQTSASAGAKKDEKPPHPQDVRLKMVREVVGSMVTTVARALPSGSRTDAERFCQISMTAIIANLSETVSNVPHDVRDVDAYVESRALVFASEGSIRRVIAQAAELDLQPGSALGYCWFIRRGESATFMVGVNGYTQLLLRHPDVSKIHADVIFEADKYQVIRGERPQLIHEPAWWLEPRVALGTGRGQRIGAYAVLTFKDGATDFCLMSGFDLDKAHRASAAPNSPAYRDWPEEMDQRSAIKRGQKRWPKSAEFERAVQMDESDSLREDLAEAIKTVEAVDATPPAPPVSKQKATLDSLTRELGARTQSAAEQLNGSRVAEGAAAGK